MEILKNRLFWAALSGLAFVILRAALPGFPLDEGQVAEVLFVLASFIAAEAVENAGGRPKLDVGAALRSRKFWAALVAIAFVLLRAVWPDFPLDEAAIEQLVWVVAAYVLGVGVSDTGLLKAAWRNQG